MLFSWINTVWQMVLRVTRWSGKLLSTISAKFLIVTWWQLFDSNQFDTPDARLLYCANNFKIKKKLRKAWMPTGRLYRQHSWACKKFYSEKIVFAKNFKTTNESQSATRKLFELFCLSPSQRPPKRVEWSLAKLDHRRWFPVHTESWFFQRSRASDVIDLWACQNQHKRFSQVLCAHFSLSHQWNIIHKRFSFSMLASKYVFTH